MRLQEASAVLRNEPEEPEGLDLIMAVKLCESFCLFIRKPQSNETQTAAQRRDRTFLWDKEEEGEMTVRLGGVCRARLGGKGILDNLYFLKEVKGIC